MSQKTDYGYSTLHYQPNCIEDLIEVTKEAKELLDERWAALLADPSSVLTIEEFRKKMSAFCLDKNPSSASLPGDGDCTQPHPNVINSAKN